MSAALSHPDPHPRPPDWATGGTARISLDRLAAGITRLCAVSMLLLSAGLLLVLLRGLLTTPLGDPGWVAWLAGGSLQVAALALLLALPLGGIAALVLSEVASPAARRLLLPPLHLIDALPAVFWGYLALAVLTPVLQPILPHLAGHSALVAGLVLGVMLMPGIITRAMAVLSTVPASQREAAAALGASPLETLRRVVLPVARPGLAAVGVLALARALGEGLIVALAAASTAPGTAAAGGGLLAPTETLSSWLLTAPGSAGAGVWTAAALLLALTGALNLLGVSWQRPAPGAP